MKFFFYWNDIENYEQQSALNEMQTVIMFHNEISFYSVLNRIIDSRLTI